MAWRRAGSGRSQGPRRARPAAEPLEARAVLSAASVPVAVAPHVIRASAVAVDGPKVVSLLKFGYHAQPTMVVLTFDQALNAATAENVYNYRFTTANGGTVLTRSAAYNATSHTVTLQTVLTLGLRKSYTLTVFATGPGGVRGASGVPLDGAGTGHPGTNYVTTVSAAQLVITDAFAPGAAQALHVAERARAAAARATRP